jgi:hypothetical protein
VYEKWQVALDVPIELERNAIYQIDETNNVINNAQTQLNALRRTMRQ